MADPSDKQQPHLTDRAQDAKRARQQREADALRANLRRRKARAGDAPRDEDSEPHG